MQYFYSFNYIELDPFTRFILLRRQIWQIHKNPQLFAQQFEGIEADFEKNLKRT